MRTKIVIVVLIWIICLMLLAACGAGAQDANANGTQIVATFVARITQTAQAAEIDSWLAESDATDTPSADVTEEPTETDVPFSTATPDPNLSLLSRFRTVTVSKGNLYVRDGTGLPTQITNDGTVEGPVISSDGKKIAFYRNVRTDQVFVINADGSDDKLLVDANLPPVNSKYGVGFLTFYSTHTVFFTNVTGMCGSLLCQDMDSFVADTDTGKIVKLSEHAGDKVKVSPDGQYFFVVNGGSGRMDLFTLDSKLVHSNLLPSAELLWSFYWLSDSSGLIAFAAKSSHDENTIWRYTLKDNQAQKIRLKPALTSDSFCVHNGNGDVPNGRASPDGNWMVYADGIEKVYLANLQNLQSQPYPWEGGCGAVKLFAWSPDSKHFVEHNQIGSVDGSKPIKASGYFIAWIDATHYLASRGKSVLDQQTYLVELGHEDTAAPVNFIWSPVYALLP